MKIYKKLPPLKYSSRVRNTLFDKLNWRIRYFLLGIKNIIRWIPTLYHDQDWDWYYTLKILQKKIEFQRKELVNSNRHTKIDIDNRDMTLALNLIERFKEEYYENELIHHCSSIFILGHCEEDINTKTTDERLDEYIKKYPSSVRGITKKYGIIEDKEKLCLQLSLYNQEKSNKLLFRILEEKLKNWWD